MEVYNSRPWQFKSIVITGGNRGIGLEIVKQLLSLPNPPECVVATCRSLEGALELNSLSKCNKNLHVVQLDVNDFEGFNQVVSEVERKLEGRRLDVLLNNAGIMDRSTLDDVTAESMVNVYKTNTVAPLMLAKAFRPLLRHAASRSSNEDSGKASIMNISSFLGSITENNGRPRYPYRTSKAALNMITKSLSIDLESEGIMAVALHPGWVKTDMGGQNAAVTTKESVEGLLTVIGSLDDSYNGGFFDFTGKSLPW